MNIRFCYFYRDAGNNKLYNEMIFSNPEKCILSELTKTFTNFLISEQYFEFQPLKIPALRFLTYDQALDHEWYEFENLEESTEDTTDLKERTITQFIKEVETWAHSASSI